MSAQNVEKQNDVAPALPKLSKATTDLLQEFKDEAQLDTFPESDDKVKTENALLFSLFVLEQAETVSSCRKLKNLNLDDFHDLHDLLHNSIVLGMFSGRERKCADSPENVLFILLIVLKHGRELTFCNDV